MCANSGTNNTTDSSRHKSKLCHSSYCSLQHGAQFPVCDEGAATDRKQGSHMRLVYNSRGSTVPGFCNVSKDARPRMSFHLLITVENLSWLFMAQFSRKVRHPVRSLLLADQCGNNSSSLWIWNDEELEKSKQNRKDSRGGVKAQRINALSSTNGNRSCSPNQWGHWLAWS